MKDGWISIKKKLPRQGKEVLIRWKNHQRLKFTSVGTLWRDNPVFGSNWHFIYYDVGGSTSLDDSEVTHWMPLPSPPNQGH